MDIRITADQSDTLFSSKYGAHYHSVYGALEESIHIYISAGLYHAYRSGKSKVSVFEMGFGTGLNSILTLIESQKLGMDVDYVAVESDPVPQDVVAELNYPKLFPNQMFEDFFHKMHQLSWDTSHKLTESFSLNKVQSKIEDTAFNKTFDIIYYDAFAPSCQPHLWEIDIQQKLYSLLNKGGHLVTYCTQGAFRRNLESLGYLIEKLNGPGKKREMIRATKG